MKLILDLAQSPNMLRTELDQAIRIALGPRFYVEEIEADAPAQNFTADELANKAINLPNASGASALPAVSAGASPASVDLDSKGLPYDSRIHSAGKTKITDGTWKKKKGVDAAEVERVEAQNRASLAAPMPTSAPATVITGQTDGELPPLGGVAPLPNIADLPPLPSLPVNPLPAEPIVVTDFASLTQYIAQWLVKEPAKTKQLVDHGLTHYELLTEGVPTLQMMAHRPEIPVPFYGWLKQMLGDV